MAESTMKGGEISIDGNTRDRSSVTVESDKKWETESQNKVLGSVKRDLLGLKEDMTDSNFIDVSIKVRAGDTLGAIALGVDRAAKAKAKEAQTEPDLKINWSSPVEYYQ